MEYKNINDDTPSTANGVCTNTEGEISEECMALQQTPDEDDNQVT
jgi:hypothetical protein